MGRFVIQENTLEIYTIDGIIEDGQEGFIGEGSVNIDIPALKPGMYIVIIKNNEYNKALRFIKIVIFEKFRIEIKLKSSN